MFGVSDEIWNGYTKKEKLYVACKKFHILKPAQILYRKFLKSAVEKENAQKKEAREREALLERCEQLSKKIEELARVETKNNILISGYLSTFRKGGNLIFRKLTELIPDIRVIALSQSGEKLTQQNQHLIGFEMLALPMVPFAGGYQKDLSIPVGPEHKKLIEEKKFLCDAIENVKAYHDDMGEGYAEFMVCYLYLTTKKIVEELNIRLLIVHNVLYPLNNVMVETCRECGVPSLFYEFGALAGTFVIEKEGQMGASFPAVHPDEFMSMPVEVAETEYAAEVIRYLKGSGLNRNEQPSGSRIDLVKKRLKPNRPVVLYAGQNDYDSGICPYDEHARQFHSPIYKNSDEAAICLADLAEKNDWNLIYKPHPLCVKHGKCLADNVPENVIWISDIDINEIIDIADVVVTILSQVCEVALTRNKAVLMLGYTQLKGKGCCYEAYEECLIENALKDAISQGLTEDQKENYRQYVARMLKYYLFDDLSERPVRFGQGMENAALYISNFLKDNGAEIEATDGVPEIAQRYIFIESDLFSKRIMSNELDFLDKLSEAAGKDNILIKLYSEDSRQRFELRGYKALYLPDDKWFALLNSPTAKDHWLVGAYPVHEFEQVSLCPSIWFRYLLIMKNNMLIRLRKNMPNNYMPKNINEFNDAVDRSLCDE